MPRITVTTSRGNIPGKTGRKQIILRAKVDMVYGWEPDLTATGDTGGVELAAGEVLCLAGKDIDLSGPLYVITASGSGELQYTEKL
jgi:hypothetical protein